MIKITKEQDERIKYWLKYFDDRKYMVLSNQEQDYDLEENLCLNSISVEELESILYIPNSFIVIETEEEKIERWKKTIKLLEDNLSASTSILREFADDFNIKL